jgi:hypothetical protein
MVPEYEACFTEFLRYAPHMNTEKLTVNKFVFGLNVNIHTKVRIFMPQTLHDDFQKALIVEEELISRGREKLLQDRWDKRRLVRNNIKHQLDIHQGVKALKEDPHS